MQTMLFVMNPFAGMRKANRYLADILTIFNRAGYRVITHMTEGPGDCAKTVTELAAQMDLIVCAGGDGTFSEAVNGLLAAEVQVPLGYIPCGSTNDFANTLKLPTNILQAAKNIAEGKPESYDIGRFNGRYFTYVASFGVFTKASYSTPQNIKNALGHTAYLLGGIQELSQIRKTHVRIETDSGIIEDDFLFGAVCNSTSVGGILNLDPKQVDMADGKFELLLLRAPKNLLEITECIQALQKQTYNCAMLTFLSTGRLTVQADPEMPWTLDGEKAQGAEKIEIENLNRAIRLMKKE